MKKEIIFSVLVILFIISSISCDNDNINNNYDCENTDTITETLPGGSISLYGATLNDGVVIDDTYQMIFGFNRIMASVNSEIGLSLPTGVNQFTAAKDGAECPVDGITDCTGSFIIVNNTDPGSILIMDTGETSGTLLFVFGVEPPSSILLENCEWVIISPYSNADIQFVRRMPEITLTYTDMVYSGECFTIDADTTAVIEPSDYSPAPSYSYSWIQVSGPVVFLGEWDSPTLIFNAPDVYMDTDITFQLTVTDDIGLTTTASVTITILTLYET